MKRRSGSSFSRRRFLATAGQAGAVAGLGHFIPGSLSTAFGQDKIPGKEKLIVRSLRPEDLETPIGLFNSFITPNDIFYVRHHLYAPSIDAASFKLQVDGEVARPLTLSLDDLKKLPRAAVTVTLECAGNGRAFFDPPVAGIQWEKGAVGTARFTGARLADVLKQAGVKASGKYIALNGGDKPIGKMPDFIRNVPIEKAMHTDTILAYEMNGVALPMLHGFPLRAIVPGWEGAYSVKWLQHVQAIPAEHEGFFVKTAYRYPTRRVAPGAAVDAKDMAPLTGLVVKSMITSPLDKASFKVGTVPVSGFAWAGERNIVRVDISTDNGASWSPAELGREREKYSWRQFKYEFKASTVGFYSIMARAADDAGNVQPIEPQWNPSGYLWNVIDRVRINVEA
jgi:DMSO/TMAO reductase YedYZ molybdopterin-dependent catalytic subunit